MADSSKKIIDLVYPELSYKIVGILFTVFNELGYGYQEKYYQKAIAKVLGDNKIYFREQVYLPLEFNGEGIGNYYLDFLIENKLILEIKRGDRFLKRNIEQVYSYLKRSNLRLGIIANFTKQGLRFKRIVNIK
ncbi:MAG: GxxExxY protein [Patescibacteria group bacterium]